jgi:hypothetical protein
VWARASSELRMRGNETVGDARAETLSTLNRISYNQIPNSANSGLCGKTFFK